MNIIVIAPRGKMGELIIQEAVNFPNLNIVGAIGPTNKDYINQDIGLVAKTGSLLGVSVSDNLEDIIKKCDVIIDFSTVEVSLDTLFLAQKYKKKLVCGTTGFSDEQLNLFKDASKDISIVYAANTSKMIHLMHKAIELLVSNLEDIDIEIIEMHDAKKKDAPSGTSLEIGKKISDLKNKDFNEIVNYGRTKQREKDDITYHSIRAGGIPSSHTIIFGNKYERIELTHHAYNWHEFARGACQCALFLEDKTAGFYNVKEALGITFE